MKSRDHQKGMTQSRLRELFQYEAETGVFTRKTSPCHSVKVGDVAGSIDKDDGYVRIFVDGSKYLAHRLAWLYVYGEWPIDMLDHRDANRSNNSINNLREATNIQNMRNSPVRKDNLLGVKCVTLHKTGRYHARIFHEGRSKSLGLHSTPQEAAHAYEAASRRLFGEFARVE